MKRKVNLLPNIITAFGLCCGLFAIFKMNMTDAGEVNREILMLTTLILIVAAFADLLDGAIARAIKAESAFGGLFDSMADAITFGVAPSVIVLKTLSIPSGTEMSYLISTAAMIFSVCGVLRLVRFNVTNARIAQDIDLIEAAKKNFTGLPIPAAAAAVISANLFLASPEARVFLGISHELQTWIMFAVMIVIGYFMVSRWKFLSLKTLHVKVTSFRQVFLLVVFTVFVVFYGFVQHFSLSFMIIAWSYVVIAWILSIIRLISGKKSQTLVDFEPDPDDELDEIDEDKL